MGSFNTTCFASQQTIASGDKCYVLPIYQSKSYRPVQMSFKGQPHSQYGVTDSTCYAGAFWNPAGSFIECEYDDYGCVTLTNNSANFNRVLHFFADLFKSAAVVEEGENSSHDLAFNFPVFLEESAPLVFAVCKSGVVIDPDTAQEEFYNEVHTAWSHMWEIGQEQRLFSQFYNGIAPMAFAIMHAISYDNLIALRTKGLDWEGNPMDQRSIFDRAIAIIEKSVTEERLLGTPKPYSHYSHAREFVSQIERVGSGNSLSFGKDGVLLNEYAADYCEGTLSKEDLFSRIKPFMDARYVASGLDELNIKFSPIVYADQDYSNEIGSSYADFVKQISEQVCANRKTYYGDEFEEQEVEPEAEAKTPEFTGIGLNQ